MFLKMIKSRRLNLTEIYVTSRLQRSQRSLVFFLSSLRLVDLKTVLRKTEYVKCESNEAESESHFLLYCTKYDDLRGILLNDTCEQKPDILYFGALMNRGWGGCLISVCLSLKPGEEDRNTCLISFFFESWYWFSLPFLLLLTC